MFVCVCRLLVFVVECFVFGSFVVAVAVFIVGLNVFIGSVCISLVLFVMFLFV